MEDTLKRCSDCFKMLDRDMFYRNAGAYDGRQTRCKSCDKIRNARMRRTNPRMFLDASKRWADKYKQEHGIAPCTQYMREHPHLRKIYNRLGYLKRIGRVVKPDGCLICGSSVNLNAHHYDYEDATHIIWLCRECHLWIHGKTANVEVLA